jgi:hypothetical protein
MHQNVSPSVSSEDAGRQDGRRDRACGPGKPRTGRMKKTLLRRENLAKLFAEFLAAMFSGGIGFAADTTEISLILFPEIAALAFDVFSRPRGKWATQPLRLIITPTITAALGVIVTRHWEYGAIAITAITLLSLVTIKLLRSNIGAAISAGVLPIVLGTTSWVYPVAIFSGLVVLAATLTLWKQFDSPRRTRPTETTLPGWACFLTRMLEAQRQNGISAVTRSRSARLRSPLSWRRRPLACR